jgi:8-oxo-dGTP pyrophosphatase MutT (NUDIX family)
MRRLLHLGYSIRRFVLRRLRIRTRGVKVMLFNDAGELLLIRNSYGKRHLFVLPGGGIGRRETPQAAAAREVREEVGLQVRDLVPVSVHLSSGEGKRDTIYLFEARADGAPLADGREVEEARFFSLDALPGSVSAATLRRIAEMKNGSTPDAAW